MSTASEKTILIANYGMGNLGSIVNMFKKVGGKAEICDDPTRIAAADKLVLPGVGAFDHGMRMLHASGLRESLEEAVFRRCTPVLGVCLGMQLMLDSSEEGQLSGLGWIAGRVARFPGGTGCLRVPHMGWNGVRPVRDNLLLPQGEAAQRFYFVHSYKVECADPQNVLAVTEYGQEFCSAFARDNIYGVQFHPEKSHVYGMAMFKRFLEL
ncbi:imidazole glycerol phosphate synthase subunit HisH [Microvirgula aerodenitrificans]|uniref:imidazole glycerol phosphate synthase subunit HisH n=1 Tax=Microvirgula aerodenitrificans TaxID=57480 RepID=UPI00248D61EF|nr:imidazole glycerol phosphate synthase subunit HisH [Microvirgula aerodenitrificans]